MKDKRFNSRLDMVLYFLRGCKRYFAFAVFFVFVLVLFELINPKIIGYTVDYIIGDMSAIPVFVVDLLDKMGGRDYVLGHLYLLSIVVIIVALLGAIARYCFRLFNSMGAEHLVKRMRDMLYDHIVHLPYSWHDVNQTGDIIQRCTSDVDMIKNFISEQLVTLVRMIVMIILALYFMFNIHAILSICAFVFIPITVLVSYVFHSRIGESFELIDAEEGRLSAIAQENLTGVRVVRAFGREAYERSRFEEKNEHYTGLWVRMMKLLGSFWFFNDIIRNFETLLVVALGAYFTVRGDMTAGSYVSFVSYNALLVFPISRLGRVVSEMSKAGVSIDRLMYIMNSDIEEDAPDAVDFPGDGDIVFDNVSFAYEGDKKHLVLKDLSFEIKKGQTIGILGGTGSGKSTIISLLDGLYVDFDGRITINGLDIRNIKKSELRSHIGLVLQEPYLFSRSIEDNIKITDDTASDDELMRVVGIASLKTSIDKFKDGLKTYVGERGVTLSGGQKQRTAISQMLLSKPDILIFDDSLSAVDAKTDAAIRRALRDEAEDRTTIIISHRITTLMHSDMILVLNDGRLIEAGSHDKLMAGHGEYEHIYNMQCAAVEVD